MNSTIQRLALLTATTALSFGAASAFNQIPGWTGGARWESDSITVRSHSTSFPSGSAARAALTAAINSWNDAPVDFDFGLSHGDTWVAYYNGQNEIWIEPSQSVMSGGLGLAMNWIVGNEIIESDVLFGGWWPWVMNEDKASLGGYAGVGEPFRAVAIHEFGHTLGLDHEAGTYNVMGDATTHLSPNGSSARAYPGEDATHGAISIYGETSGEDLGVSHWQLAGASQGYSLHGRSAVTDTSGNVLAFEMVKGEPVFDVGRGDDVVVTFAFENNGASSQKRWATYYWSTNNTISTYDHFMVNAKPTVNRNTVYMRKQTLTIPTNLTVNKTYYLGVVVDRYDDLNELQENNNATYVGIRVVD